MPLDVQPLSAGRRIALILVMLGLLAGSLAFADYLAIRRTSRPLLDATFNVPKGAGWPPPVSSIDTVLRRRARNRPLDNILVDIDGNARGLMAVRFYSSSGDSPADWGTLLGQIIQSLTANPQVMEPMIVHRDVILGGRPAIETAVGLTDAAGKARSWWMVRLTESGGTGVAICLSGDGTLTDADKAWFDDYCRNGVTMRLVAPPKRKG